MEPAEVFLPAACLRLPGFVLLCLGTVLAVTHTSAQSSMEPKIIEQSEFSIIGIQVRTSNAKEMTGQGDIPKQWSKFYKEGIADSIPNKVDSTIYAIRITPATTTVNTISSLE
jgi:DMSO/TMAO reductase YedYZ molybdopterin-dependent catalytic subunit